MKKFMVKCLLLVILIIIAFAGYLYYIGNSLYTKKTNEISIENKVKQVQSSENYTKLENVPKDYLNAVIAVEDHRFYEHGAVDYIALLRAGARNFQKKDLIEGGSTITQQVAKNLYFIEER